MTIAVDYLDHFCVSILVLWIAASEVILKQGRILVSILVLVDFSFNEALALIYGLLRIVSILVLVDTAWILQISISGVGTE